MPSVKSILETEKHNISYVYLYKEGVFLKAYQHSAYLFLKHCKGSYEVKCRYMKSVAADVYSIAFPQAALSKHFCETEIEHTDGDNSLRIKVEKMTTSEYEQWEDKFVPNEKKKGKDEAVNEIAFTDDSAVEIIARLKSFNVSMSTPMDCMLLIAELQKKCMKYGI